MKVRIRRGKSCPTGWHKSTRKVGGKRRRVCVKGKARMGRRHY